MPKQSPWSSQWIEFHFLECKFLESPLGFELMFCLYQPKLPPLDYHHFYRFHSSLFMIRTLVYNETNLSDKDCISNANGSFQSTTQSSYLDYWQMFSITNAKPKTKKKVFSFPKVHFFMLFVDHPCSKSVVEVFPSNPLSLRTIKNTK